MKKLFYIGLDVHRDTIVIAVARTGREPAMQLCYDPGRRRVPVQGFG